MWLPINEMPVIYNAVDFAALDGAPSRDDARRALDLCPDALVVGIVARLSEQKGHRYLLDAIAALGGRYPSLVLVVVGDGPLEDALRAQAQRLDITDRVRFLGVRRDLAA